MTNAEKIFQMTGAEAVLTEQDFLRKYLTGFASSFGYVITDKNGTIFYTDSRYIEAANSCLSNSGIVVKEYNRSVSVYDLIKNYKSIAIPVGLTYAPQYNKILEMGVKIVDSLPAFTKLMAIKSDEELSYIERACKITDEAFVELLPKIKEGMTETQVAAELEYLMRVKGASGTSFDSIVAFGANSSVPHHETGETKLKFGDVILIDFGCKVGGYCSDCTRTFLFGDDGNKEKFKNAYECVLKAHMLAKERTVAGITGKECDAYARDCLKERGFDGYFTHSLGHGIGIQIHEFPTISPASTSVLENGMVFSDEPGVYFEGEFGIRIEDTVTLKDGKVVSLTNSNKKLIIL